MREGRGGAGGKGRRGREGEDRRGRGGEERRGNPEMTETWNVGYVEACDGKNTHILY